MSDTCLDGIRRRLDDAKVAPIFECCRDACLRLKDLEVALRMAEDAVRQMDVARHHHDLLECRLVECLGRIHELEQQRLRWNLKPGMER